MAEGHREVGLVHPKRLKLALTNSLLDNDDFVVELGWTTTLAELRTLLTERLDVRSGPITISACSPSYFRRECPGPPGAFSLSARSVFHSKSNLYGSSLWAQRVLNGPLWRILAWAARPELEPER